MASLPLHRRLVLHTALEPRRARAAQHDVEAIGEAVELHGVVAVERGDELADRGLARHRAQDRALRYQRITLEIHLRDQPLRPAVARNRIVNVRGAPVVDAVAPWIGAGLDRTVHVMAVAVGQYAAAAAEVGIDRRDVRVVPVPVAAAGIRLPHLDQRVLHRPAEFVPYVAVDDDALADRKATVR